MRSAIAAVLFTFSAAAPAAETTAITVEGKKFIVPAGFIVERAAGPPLFDYPIMAGFDDRGRLLVGDTAGPNLPAAELLRVLPGTVRRLSSSRGDGRFDRSEVLADKLTFPMGALWHRGALYVCASPSVWKFTADTRQELVSKFGFTGNAADLHGPYAAPDGMLYWTDGRHGHEIKRPDGTVLAGKAARVFRCAPDGSRVETVCGGGMDNPVGVAFTDEGEAFATVNILISSPARMDALIHCVEGGVWPHYEPVLGEFRKTGGLLPPMTELGWVAPSGLTRYRGTAFGPDHVGNLFSTQFNTHKVVRHVLERRGATFRTRDETFLACDDPDFHPTDVIEDADGSLLVIDTGGWFRRGCPTSRVAKPEVKGAVWRVRKADAAVPPDPRGLAIDWNRASVEDLIRSLDDPRFPVRDAAIEAIADRGAVGQLAVAATQGATERLRRNAVWSLTRVGGEPAQAAVRPALGDPSASVRQATAHSAGLHRDAGAGPKLAALAADDDDPAVRREAATALGRIGRPDAVPALLAGLQRANGDRFLEHALVYALITTADPGGTRAGLADPSPAVRRAVLTALDQMPNGRLTADEVLPYLESVDPAFQKAAWAIAAGRSEWANELGKLLAEWLAADLPTRRRAVLGDNLPALARTDVIRPVIVSALTTTTTPPATKVLLLDTAASTGADRPIWGAAVAACLASPDEGVLRHAVAAVRAAGLPGCDDALVRLADDASKPAGLRTAAIGALVEPGRTAKPAWYDLLRSRLSAEQPPLDRLAAATALGRLTLSAEQQLALAGELERAGALELPYLLAALGKPQSPAAWDAVLSALGRSPAFPSLLPDRLAELAEHAPARKAGEVEQLRRRLRPDEAGMRARLTELTPVLAGGDAGRGRAVFFGRAAACAACHAVGGVGGRVGPDLSAIGTIRTDRDLLEAVVFPSASLVRGYEPVRVATHDGKALAGVLRGETADGIVLVTGPDQEVRLPRADIDEVRPGQVSLMPAGLDKQLTPGELADLIAYLKSLR